MKRALIIEDNENNMELITFILEANGFQTLQAGSGVRGLEIAAAEHPDFILLDIQLPDILGFEVVARLRRIPSCAAIPVIAVTSYAMAGDRERLLAAGCDGYIEKPIDPMRFVEQINKVLR